MMRDTWLRPWHATLAPFGRPLCAWRDARPSADDEPRLWIGGLRRGLPRPRAQLQRLWEALSLLAALARADAESCVRELDALWPRENVASWAARLPAAPFGVGVLFSELGLDDVERLAELDDARTVGLAAASSEYQAARARIEAVAALRRDTRGPAPPPATVETIRVCLEVEGSTPTKGQATELLEKTVAFVLAQRSTPSLHAKPFVVEDVRFPSTGGVVLDDEGLACLVRLQQVGVRVHHLPTFDISRADDNIYRSLVRSVRTLTDSDSGVGVRTATVTDRFCASDVPTVLTAVQESTCVDTVEIEFGEYEQSNTDAWEGDDGLEEFWEWVAYALCSRHAHHRVTTLEMNLENLQLEDVASMRQIIEARDPLAQLHGAAADPHAPRQVVVRRFLVAKPQSSVQLWTLPFVQDRHQSMDEFLDKCCVLKLPQPIAVRVFFPSVEEYWSVLLPGHGLAWVHQSDIVSTIASDRVAPLPAFPRIGVTKMSDESIDAVIALLELIGRATTHIELHEYVSSEDGEVADAVPIDAWCRRLFPTCPRLDELVLSGGYLDSLQVFVDAAEAGHCHLRQLTAWHVFVSDIDHVHSFFRALCDHAHPLTTHLEDLDVVFMIEGMETRTDEIVAAAKQMLDTNRRLRRIQISFRLSDDSDSLQPLIVASFASHCEENVAIRLGPLELRQKLAFLRTLDGPASSSVCRSLQKLDTGVISSIFEFAALACTRKFQLDCRSYCQ